MDRFFSGQAIEIVIPLVVGDVAIEGAYLVEYRLLDERGTVVSDWQVADYNEGDPQVTITTLPEENQISGVSGYRQVELRVGTEAGDNLVLSDYLLSKADALIPMVNSFMTIGSAMIEIDGITNVETIRNAQRTDAVRGLVNAYTTLCDLIYLVAGEEVNLKRLDLAGFEALPTAFQSAIRRAQIIEADEALNLFSVRRKRQEGLMSETIGESSMMFRPEKVLNVPVTRRSLDLLRAYLIWDMGTARA